MLAIIGAYAIVDINAHSNGLSINNLTDKYTNTGCYCHCTSSSTNTTVTLSTSSGSSPLTASPSTSYTFTVTVANSSESDGGVEVASYSGSGLAAGTGLQLVNGELTHSTPKSFTGGSCSWTFTYTSGSTAGYDTLYATGNAVNGDGSNGLGGCSDEWNNSSKFIIHVVAPSKRIALGRTSVALGSLRVGHRKADSLLVSSTGDAAITINSSSLKSGAPFSNSPTSTNRSLSNGSTEMDSLAFAPTARGTFSDSLIFSTNSDTVPQQRLAVYVSGQGVQAIFTSPNGTTLAFGNLRTGRTRLMPFVYENTGDDTLFLQTPAISGAGFSIASGPSNLTLVPNQSDTVMVAFAPTSKQTYSGTLSFSASNGVTAPSVSLSGAGTLPQIQISTTASLGSSHVNQQLLGTIQFHNTGNDTLHLSNFALTQPGAKFSLGNFPTSVLPGAAGTIQINYLPNLERQDSATLHFVTDDPTDSSVTVLVTASGALPHMAVADHDTVNMGDVKLGDSTTRDFTIENTGTDILTVTNVAVSPTPPFYRVSAPQFIAAGNSNAANILFAPISLGTFYGTVIVSGDDPNVPSDTIDIIGTGINSALSVPANLDFGAVPVGTPVTKTVTLTNSGTASVKIISYKLTQSTNVFSKGDTVASVAGSGTATISIHFTPASATSYTGTLTLTTDDASTPIRTINLAGSGVSGQLAWVPSTLDFSNVDTGKSRTMHASLRNTGGAAITVSSFTITGSSAYSHSAVTTPAIIAAGDSLPVDITFSPTALGSQGGMLNAVKSDQSLAPLILTGTGVPVLSGVDRTTASTSGFGIILSPNPAKDAATIYVHSLRSMPVEVRLFDASGREVSQVQPAMISDGASQLNLITNGLPSGSYFVRVSGPDGEVAEGKLIIAR
jgi:hypothetical protein